jgi:predicted ATPase
MLKTLRIEGFRCLRDLTLEFEAGQPMILLGANGSGKSTVMEALLFVAQIFDQNPLDHVFKMHSGGGDILWRGAGSGERLRFTMTSEGEAPWVYQFELGPSNRGLDVRYERLTKGERELLLRDAEECTVFNVTSESSDTFKIDRDLALIGLRQTSLYPWREEVVRLFGGGLIYPGFKVGQPWMQSQDNRRPYSSATVQPDLYLTRHGENIVNALHRLYSYGDARWSAIEDDFRREFERCRKFRFVPSEQTAGQMRFQWLDESVDKDPWVDLGFMSDGMLAYLMMLTAIHGAPEGVMLAFDEPEVHLHPSLLLRVTARLVETAGARRVVVATHSDALLDALDEGAVDAIRVMKFEKDAGSIFAPLDPTGLAEWRREYTFGALRAMGTLKTSL